jgi:NAD(P)H-dependent FMN reductase
MKILVFGASNSKESINQQLAVYVSSLIENAQTEVLDLNDFEVPLYSIDRENETGIPEKIKDFVNRISESDALVISMAEHNGAYTAAFKNIMDWSSRHELSFFQEKPMMLLATSPGGYGAKNVLGLAKQRFPKFGGNIISSYSLPSFYDSFKQEKGIIDDALLKELETNISTFKASLDKI